MISKLALTFSTLQRLLPLAIVVLLGSLNDAYSQVTTCPYPAPQTTGSHRFRQAGESFNIPITVADCESVALELRWSNGPNNGSNFNVTFLDGNNQPIYSKLIWGFLTGNQQFPFATMEVQPWLGSTSLISVPTIVSVQAVQPFAYPSSISYRVMRASRQPQPQAKGIDDQLVMNLRNASGRLLAGAEEAGAGGSKSLKFRLEELTLAPSRELELHGKRVVVENALRLKLSAAEASNADLIWLNDVALPISWRNDRNEVGVLIYDRSILRDDAEISLSKLDGSQLHSLLEPLKVPASFKTASQPLADEGNAILAIRRAVRVIGVNRQPLVQIEMRTNRPFPARETALQLQVGKKFFLNELSGDPSGRTITLSLTPEGFATLKDGAEVVAFFDKPDRSGASGADVWDFGRLNKKMLDGSNP